MNSLKEIPFLFSHVHHFKYSGAQNATVKVGTNEMFSGGSEYQVYKIIPHENFNQTNYSNDICLIQINGVIKFTEKVQPI